MRKISNRTLLNKLKSGKVICPNCGCEKSYVWNGYAPFPEVWNVVYCSCCKMALAYQDNSPWTTFQDEIKYLVKEGLEKHPLSLKDYRSIFNSFYDNGYLPIKELK